MASATSVSNTSTSGFGTKRSTSTSSSNQIPIQSVNNNSSSNSNSYSNSVYVSGNSASTRSIGIPIDETKTNAISDPMIVKDYDNRAGGLRNVSSNDMNSIDGEEGVTTVASDDSEASSFSNNTRSAAFANNNSNSDTDSRNSSICAKSVQNNSCFSGSECDYNPEQIEEEKQRLQLNTSLNTLQQPHAVTNINITRDDICESSILSTGKNPRDHFDEVRGKSNSRTLALRADEKLANEKIVQEVQRLKKAVILCQQESGHCLGCNGGAILIAKGVAVAPTSLGAKIRSELVGTFGKAAGKYDAAFCNNYVKLQEEINNSQEQQVNNTDGVDESLKGVTISNHNNKRSNTLITNRSICKEKDKYVRRYWARRHQVYDFVAENREMQRCKVAHRRHVSALRKRIRDKSVSELSIFSNLRKTFDERNSKQQELVDENSEQQDIALNYLVGTPHNTNNDGSTKLVDNSSPFGGVGSNCNINSSRSNINTNSAPGSGSGTTNGFRPMTSLTAAAVLAAKAANKDEKTIRAGLLVANSNRRSIITKDDGTASSTTRIISNQTDKNSSGKSTSKKVHHVTTTGKKDHERPGRTFSHSTVLRNFKSNPTTIKADPHHESSVPTRSGLSHGNSNSSSSSNGATTSSSAIIASSSGASNNTICNNSSSSKSSSNSYIDIISAAQIECHRPEASATTSTSSGKLATPEPPETTSDVSASANECQQRQIIICGATVAILNTRESQIPQQQNSKSNTNVIAEEHANNNTSRSTIEGRLAWIAEEEKEDSNSSTNNNNSNKSSRMNSNITIESNAIANSLRTTTTTTSDKNNCGPLIEQQQHLKPLLLGLKKAPLPSAVAFGNIPIIHLEKSGAAPCTNNDNSTTTIEAGTNAQHSSTTTISSLFSTKKSSLGRASQHLASPITTTSGTITTNRRRSLMITEDNSGPLKVNFVDPDIAAIQAGFSVSAKRQSLVTNPISADPLLNNNIATSTNNKAAGNNILFIPNTLAEGSKVKNTKYDEIVSPRPETTDNHNNRKSLSSDNDAEDDDDDDDMKTDDEYKNRLSAKKIEDDMIMQDIGFSKGLSEASKEFLRTKRRQSLESTAVFGVGGALFIKRPSLK